MDDWKRHTKVAIGGWRCPCCGPTPKDRPQWRRATRRRLKADSLRLAEDQLHEQLVPDDFIAEDDTDA